MIFMAIVIIIIIIIIIVIIIIIIIIITQPHRRGPVSVATYVGLHNQGTRHVAYHVTSSLSCEQDSSLSRKLKRYIFTQIY